MAPHLQKVSALALVLFLQVAVAVGQTPAGITNVLQAPDIDEICILEPTFHDAYFVVHPKKAKGIKTANFEVDYLHPEGDPDWPNDAIDAFEYAVNIWESHINSDIPIRVQANWVEMDEENVLANAGPTLIVQIDEGMADTWYPIAQASAITGIDFVEEFRGTANEVNYDIIVNVNSSFNNWYFGTDANPVSNRMDFVTVILHEIGHGLGFTGSVVGDEDENIAEWGFGSPPDPIIYDRFTTDGHSNNLINESIYPNPSSELLAAVTGEEGGVFFAGDESILVNNGLPVPLYAPDEWEEGSSYSHLDQNLFSDTDDALMRPQIDFAFAVHSPGPVVCGMFDDMGWPLGNGCIALINILAESVINVEVEALDFGVTNVESARNVQLTIFNEENAVDPLIGRALVNNDDNFFAQNDVQYFNVEPGDSTEIRIFFDPPEAGEHQGVLEIFHNSPEQDNPISIPLTGEALEQNQVVVLDENFPNPFQNNTTITYAVPSQSRVQLDIFNVLGEHITNLVDEMQESGRYSHTFNGSSLSSGVYFYVIRVKDASRTGKLLKVN